MARAPKSNAAQSDCLLVNQSNPDCRSNDFSLGLNPAELEALLEKLCSCSTLRVSGSGRGQYGERCLQRLRKGWCRFGERSADGKRIETRFG
jgi:hypothetical protein